MVHIRLSFNSFHCWAASAGYGRSPRLFNLFFLFYSSSLLSRPRLSIRRKVARTLVVLKSPFHYKNPKHHIQYKYYVITAAFSVRPDHASKAKFVLSRYFVQNKASRTLLRSEARVRLGKLL